MFKSQKNKIPLENLMSDKHFVISNTNSNAFNALGERGVSVGINGRMHFIPTGRSVALSLDVFSVLRDAGYAMRETDQNDFDPLNYEKNLK